MARVILRQDDVERVIELVDPVTVIGRAPESTIMLDVQECSRRQAQIEKCEAGYKLVDLESRNGTKVNGKVANQHLLATGDIVKIGKITLKFESTPPAAPSPATVAAQASPSAPAAAFPPDKHHPPVVPTDRRTRRARRSALRENSATGAAGIVVALIAGVVTVALMRSGLTDEEAAQIALDDASRIEAKDPDAAIRKLRTVVPQAGHLYDEAQARIRAVQRRQALARGIGLTEEQSFENLRNFVERHSGPTYADQVIRDVLEFKATFPKTSHASEADEWLAEARKSKNAAQLNDIQKAETEIAALLRRANFGGAVQAVNALYARHRSDLQLRATIEKRYREVVDAGRAWFTAQIDAAKKLKDSQPDEARRICSEIVSSLGDGKVEEFSTACTMALLIQRMLSPY